MITFEKLQQTKKCKKWKNAIVCFLDYNYFKKYYKMIAIDLSKQQALDADLETIRQINFTGNLEQ